MQFPSIEHYKLISKTRSDLGFWAENILESEKIATTEQELKHFFAYITNPRTYEYTTVEQSETLGDLEKRGELPEYEPADERQTAEVYQNGREYKIFVRTKSIEDLDDDEKCPT